MNHACVEKRNKNRAFHVTRVKLANRARILDNDYGLNVLRAEGLASVSHHEDVSVIVFHPDCEESIAEATFQDIFEIFCPNVNEGLPEEWRDPVAN